MNDQTPKDPAQIHEGDALNELLELCIGQRTRGLELLERLPMIRGGTGKKRNTGIYVDAEVLKRAREKAEHEKIRTGGSLSQLMELLLWQYIGSPEDLVATK